MSNGNIENIDGAARELIIIRRGSGEDMAAAKGGAWKIAYADFVTAMMAFFLVMWLINSANEATKARVASYFNPIKMTDASPANRSLKSDDTAKPAKGKQKNDPETTGSTGSAGAKTSDKHNVTDKQIEDAVLANPFKALDEISTEGAGHPSGRTVEITTQRTGDPFDPQVWEALRNGTFREEKASNVSEVNTGDEQSEADNAKGKLNPAQDMEKSTQTGITPGNGEASKTQDEKTAENRKTADQFSQEDLKTADALKAKLQSIKRSFPGLTDLGIDVRLTEEGILIVLEDGNAVTMFKVGSAVPNPAMVDFIGSIGSLLDRQGGGVIVRGHTDARRFQTGKFDNWQLSTARAHMASYMLMRGGLPEARIRKIEGHGAAALLDRQDPLAGTNRRVEIVLVPEP
jgi:chemotaxis protein MotB